MTDLVPLSEALDEINALFAIDEDAAAQFLVLLDELDNDPTMRARLFRPNDHYKYEPPFKIYHFVELQRKGKNVYIIKVRSVNDGPYLPYRLLLGYHSQIDTFYVLTLIEREIDYDVRDPTIVAALERYDGCGIPTYPH